MVISLEKIDDNSFKLDFSSYMKIYFVVNVEKLRLYEPPLIQDQGEHVQIPSIEEFSPEYLDQIQQDIKMREFRLPSYGDQRHKSKQGQMDRDWKGEGIVPSSAEQMKVSFLGPKASSGED